MTPDPITPELTAALRRVKLGRLLDTLPQRLVLARQQQMPHQDFLLLLLSDEIARRDSAAVALRATHAALDPTMTLEQWDPTAKVTYDRPLWNELVSLRFIAAHTHVALIGPVGVGKTFLAHALGWLACRHGYSVLALTADKMLKTLKHARLDHTYEPTLRRLLAVDLLLLDDFGLDALDPTESRDTYEILIERHRAGSIVVTSNHQGPSKSHECLDLVRPAGYWGRSAAGRGGVGAWARRSESESRNLRRRARRVRRRGTACRWQPAASSSACSP